MSEFGKDLIQSAYEALELVEGEMNEAPKEIWRVAAAYEGDEKNGLGSWPNEKQAGPGAIHYTRTDTITPAQAEKGANEMNIDDLTIGQAKILAGMLLQGENTKPTHVGKKCIIRCYASGNHFGELVTRNGREVELINARRLWRWHTGGEGVSLSEISQTGIDQNKSKICVEVPSITLLDALEVIPCSDISAKTIEGAKVYKP